MSYNNWKVKGRKKYKKPVKTAEEIEAIASQLHPMAGAMYAAKFATLDEKVRNQGLHTLSDFERFTYDTAVAILQDNSKLSEKWVASINKMVVKELAKYAVVSPDHEEGAIVELRDLKVLRCGRKEMWNTYFCMAADSNGWKYYFTSSRLQTCFEYLEVRPEGISNLRVAVTARVSGEDVGINFLKRPTKVVVSGIPEDRSTWRLNPIEGGDWI